MKAPYLLLTFFILATTSFFSCSKDDDDDKNDNINYPLTVNLYDISYSNIRLFTNQREIVDKNVINDFVKNAKPYFFLEQQDIQSRMLSRSSITFTSKDSIIFSDTNLYSVVSDKKKILFFSEYYIPFNDQSNHPFTIWDVLKYLAPKEPMPLLSGYTYRQKVIHVAQGDYAQLELLGFNYKYAHQDENSQTQVMSSLFNQYDESQTSRFGTRDTLAIQEFKYHFRK